MQNKTTELNNFLRKLSREDLSGYELVDYWDADTTAIGLKKGKILIYISVYNYSETELYDFIIEEFETGKVFKSEEKNHTKNLFMISIYFFRIRLSLKIINYLRISN